MKAVALDIATSILLHILAKVLFQVLQFPNVDVNSAYFNIVDRD